MKLWMLTEIPGAVSEAAALVWADDPDEARRLLREKIGNDGRVCIEVQPEKGVAALIGVSAAEVGDPVAYARAHAASPQTLALLDEVERGRQRRATRVSLADRDREGRP